MGVVDILQQYNYRKQIESTLKGFRYDSKEVSSIKTSVR